MYRHILIPTDGSTLSLAAAQKALEFARDAVAKVTVLTVVEPFHVFTSDTEKLESTAEEYERQAGRAAGSHLADVALKAEAMGVACDTVQVVSDEPYQAIIDVASQKGCDLIAMASHGRRGLAALVLGSVAVKVLTHSTIPVLVYR